MKIKRLEISGFKSFVDKAVFDFQQGVTAIVGPNGCGKSNVVDAMRWAMGEQSAKNLRGRQMEDVIFGGSDTRRPVGMAEVSLVFSTEDGRVPAKYLSFSEIQVTRRLYRDGESEYLLNRTPCRLMDISELFMDTGIGAKAYSVIEQGRIGMILHAKPEDRRFLVEEAAGVTKYKVRKQVALKKIDITRQNLVRLADIIGEIKRQLGALQRQAKKAESFKVLREEARGLEILLAGQELLSLVTESDALAALLRQQEVEAGVMATAIAAADLKLEEGRCRQVEQEQSLAALQETCFGLRGEIQGEEGRLEMARREMEALARQAERADAESAAIAAARAAAQQEQQGLRELEAAAAAELQQAGSDLAGADEALTALTEEELTLSRDLEGVRQELFGLLSRAAEVGNRRSAAARRIEALSEGRERRAREAETLKGNLAEAARLRDNARGLHGRAVAERGEKALDLERLRHGGADLRSRSDELLRTLQGSREQLTAASSRLRSLRELEAQFVGYGQGVKTLLSAPGFAARFSRVLADVVETDPSWEQALEAVLAERVQYLLAAGGGEAALDAVSYLKGNGGGRCGFLVSTPRVVPHEPPAGCRPLAGLVTVKPEWASLVHPLLASTYVVEDLSTALELARRHAGAGFVTPDGDLLAADGTLTCGSSVGGGGGLIHKKREIRELDQRVAVVTGEVAELEASLETCKAEAAALAARVSQGEQELHRIDLQILTQEKDLARYGEDCRRLEELRSLRELEDRQRLEEEEALRSELESVTGQEGELLAAKSGLEQSVNDRVASLDLLRRRLGEARERQTALKVRTASLAEKRESALRGAARIDAQFADLDRREALVRTEREHAAVSRGTIEATLAALQVSLDERRRQLTIHEERAQKERLAWEEAAGVARDQETSLRQLRSEHDALGRRVAEGKLRHAELAMKREHLAGMLQERHNTLPEEAMDAARSREFISAEAEQRLSQLKRQLDDLGEVNLAALEDYRQLDERHSFLVDQKADLEESLQGLQKAIGKINRTTRQRFLETFNLINDRFRELFPRLFCGGSAELRLTNEEDLLETGIDIIVQPPGKKLQNVSLLSGGEKALTAVALIFSIFQIKPSPFCLLDEVDAPLDEANIGRFNELVREMSRFSQFIMITHSKATMAVADTLYGITMEEPGVSKVVSVSLSGGSGG